MKIGQKVLYNEETYVVAGVEGTTCTLISEEYYAVYNMAGVGVKGSTLRTFDAPDGSIIIINSDGTNVGYMEVPTTDVEETKEYVEFNREIYSEAIL